MNTSDEKNVGIGLRDIFFYIMRKWRFVLCLGVGCAVLFGAYKVCRLILMIQSVPYQSQAWELYENAVDHRESEFERLDAEIADLKVDLELKQIYADNSYLMKLDPYNSVTASIDICILGADDNATYLRRVFQSSFNAGRITGRMAELLGEDEQYLHERMRMQDYGSYDGYFESTEAISALTNKTMLHIGLIAEDKAAAERDIDALTVTLNELSGTLNQTVGAHELVLLENGCLNYTANGLDNYQKGIRESISTLSASLEQKQNEKDALEIPVYELMPLREAIISSLKLFLLGGFVGGCLSLLILFVRCLSSEEIISPDELKKRTGLKTFTISAPGQKSLRSKLDRFIVGCELKGCILSLESVRKRLELEPRGSQSVIWGELPETMLEAILPPSVDTVYMDNMDSWQKMLSSGQEQCENSDRNYFLIVDRKKDTYKTVTDKLDVISMLCGNVICILCV